MHTRSLAFIALTFLILSAFGSMPKVTQAAETSGAGTTFVVNSEGDGSDSFLNGICDTTAFGGETVCTLRAAIQEANRTPELDIIEFNIPAPGIGIIPYAATIKPDSNLPAIDHPVIFDGRTQPQGMGPFGPITPCASSNSGTHNLLITLDGSNISAAGADGFLFAGPADDSAVYGMTIVNFTRNGINTLAGGLTIQCNHIGILRDGETAAPNSSSGIVISSVRDVLVGGPDSEDRNVISGNNRYGVLLTSVSAITVRGNFIGTDEEGESAVPNSAGISPPAGVSVRNAGSAGGNVIGPDNVISGNSGHGILIADSAETSVLDNRIGIGSSGASSPSIPNTGSGIFMLSASATLIGGESVFTNNGNTIANNQSDGITVGAGSSDTTIESNSIRDNTLNGILIEEATSTGIGTDNSGNTLIRNGQNGIEVKDSPSSATRIENNSIGITSGLAIAAGNVQNGIFINESSDVTIGESAARGGSNGAAQGGSSGNVIGSNLLNGILVSGRTSGVNTINGNAIGTTNGSAEFPNGASGILFMDQARTNKVGNVEANTIRFNAGNGITADPTTYVNRIRGNNISQNGLLGIDLGNDEVTLNDVDDMDSGANQGMNFPVITGVELAGNTLVVSATLNAVTSLESVEVDLFISADCDESGYGEGELAIDSASLTSTDGNFVFAISSSFLMAPEVGEYVTMTATDPLGNTSEFSRCAQIFSTPTAVTLQAEQVEAVSYEQVLVALMLLLACCTLVVAARRLS